MVNAIHQFNKLDYILVGQKINESLFIFIGWRLYQQPHNAFPVFGFISYAY